MSQIKKNQEYDAKIALVQALIVGGCEIKCCHCCHSQITTEPHDWTLHEDSNLGEVKIWFCQKPCADEYYRALEKLVFADDKSDYQENMPENPDCSNCGQFFSSDRVRSTIIHEMCHECFPEE
jgi:hypothetical protein